MNSGLTVIRKRPNSRVLKQGKPMFLKAAVEEWDRMVPVMSFSEVHQWLGRENGTKAALYFYDTTDYYDA